MFHLIHCCLKATHKQDSRWSLVVCISATFTQIINMGILRSSGVLFPVLMQEFGTTRERTGKLQINSIRRHRNNNYVIIIINNNVLTVYQKTNACIVMSAKRHWYPCSRPQWTQQITGNALQIFLKPDEKIDNGPFF